MKDELIDAAHLVIDAWMEDRTASQKLDDAIAALLKPYFDAVYERAKQRADWARSETT